MKKIIQLFTFVLMLTVSAPSFAEGSVAKAIQHSFGKEGAPVTLIEFASLSCPHCADFHNDILPELEKKYVEAGKLRVIFRDFPLNEPALRASMLAQCAEDERYFKYLKVLFKSQKRWAFDEDFLGLLKNIAKLGGMTDEAFDQCMADKSLEEKILAARLESAKQMKVQSTPTIFINGVKYQGKHSVEAISGMIDKVLGEIE